MLGNSVSLPPAEDPAVCPWPTLLAQRGFDVRQWSRDGGTVQHLEEEAGRRLSEERVDAVILQTGIVDCAPRPLSDRERTFVGLVRPLALRRAVVSVLHRHRADIIRRRALIQVMPLAAFEAHFARLFAAAAAGGRAVAVLPIFPVPSSVHARNPLLAREMAAYNDAMRRLASPARFFEAGKIFGDDTPDDLAIGPDSVHLNGRGHERVAAAMAAWLSSLDARH